MHAQRRPAVSVARELGDRRRACLPRHGAILTALVLPLRSRSSIKQPRRAAAAAARAAHGTSPTRAGCASRRRRARARRRSRVPPASTRLAGAPLRGEPVAQLVEAVGRVEDAAHDELRRDDAVPAVLLQPERDVVALLAPEAVELAAHAERDRRAGVAAALAHAEAQVLAVADRVDGRRPRSRRRAARHRDCRARTVRAAAELGAEVERRASRRERSRRCASTGRRSSSESTASACAANAAANVSTRSALDRQPGGGTVTAEALRCAGARAEARVQVERRHRAARALPLAVGAGDQHDRPVVALDEPRGDDADHALVPALAGDDVAAPAAARLGPRLDLVDRLARDPLLDGLPLAVQRLELLGERLRLVGVLGQQQRERSLGPAEPAGRVDARREPEADRRLVDRRGIDAARRASARAGPTFCVCASRRRPSSASARFSSTSGTTSATVASATTSRCRSQERMVGTEERLRELPDDAGAAEARERDSRPSAARRPDRRGTSRPGGGGR